MAEPKDTSFSRPPQDADDLTAERSASDSTRARADGPANLDWALGVEQTRQSMPVYTSGQAIGRFVLAEEIARGGMGIVFRAVDPAFGRDVAVKVVREQFAGNQAACQRFLEEAQITGQLQHPGIPPVHELGVLADGRPYLVMKLIKGQTLHALILGEHALNTPRSLGKFIAIFEHVCQAIAYVHSRGVIHRDLKPQNIMVGAFGEVQVMDWGLAKFLTGGPSQRPAADIHSSFPPTQFQDPRSESDTGDTQPGSILGTPAFMPPEQAAGVIELIDQQTDVFGLGAILYQILTGKPPYGGDSAEAVRLKAARGELREAFLRLDSCGAETELIQLAKHCLAVAKEDRPRDAGAVAAAIAAIRSQAEERARQAELDRVQADAQRQRAELRAIEQRKRRQVWLGLAATLLLGLIGSATLAISASRARDQAIAERNEKERQRDLAQKAEEQAKASEKAARTERDRAELERANAVAVRDFLRNHLISRASVWEQANAQRPPVAKSSGPRHDITVRELLDNAAREFAPEAIDARFPRQPEVQAEILETIGEAYEGTGAYAQAVAFVQAATVLREKTLGRDHPAAIASAINLAFLNMTASRHADAIKIYLSVLERLERLLQTPPPRASTASAPTVLDPADEATAAALKVVERRLDLRRSSQGPTSFGIVDGAIALLQLTQALPRIQRIADLAEARFGEDDRRAIFLRLAVGFAHQGLGQLPRAIPIYERSLAKAEKVLNPDDTLLIGMRMVLAGCYAALHIKESTALGLWEKCYADLRRILGPEHPTTLRMMFNVATSYDNAGRAAEALALREETVRLQKKLLGTDHPDTLRSMSNLAYSYAHFSRHAEALKLREQVLTAQKEKLGINHPDTMTSMDQLAGSYAAFGRHTEALQLREQAVALHKQKAGINHPDTLTSMNNLALSLVAVGRQEDALKLREETLTLRKQRLGTDHPDTLRSMHALAQSYADVGRRDEALALFEETLTLQTQRLSPGHRDTLFTLGALAQLRADLGKHAEARDSFRLLIERLEPLVQNLPNDRDLNLALAGADCKLGTMLRETGQPSEGLPWFAKGQARLDVLLARNPGYVTARVYLRNIHLDRARTLEQLERFTEADADWAKATELCSPIEAQKLKAEQLERKAKRRDRQGPDFLSQGAQTIGEGAELVKRWDAGMLKLPGGMGYVYE